MYTQCPHCEAVFRVSIKEITAANGKLRCGECSHVFNGMDSVSSSYSQQLNKIPSPHTSNTPVTPAYPNIETSQNYSKKLMLWAIVGLIALMLLQIAYSSRNWLAHQPLSSGITRSTCRFIGCSITPKRDASQIKITSRNVYAHPNEPNSLIIAATFNNEAKFTQPLPLIEVNFLDKTGKIVALRRFRPDEYLQNKQSDKLFSPNETITFRIKIADPGEKAVTFQFKFL